PCGAMRGLCRWPLHGDYGVQEAFMSDPRRDRRLLTTDPTRAHQGPQNDGPFDLPDSPHAWDRQAHLRRDAHILDVGDETDATQTFELVPPADQGGAGNRVARTRHTDDHHSDEAAGPLELTRTELARAASSRRTYGFGVVILTQGKRPDELRRGIDSLLAQKGVDLDIVCVGNGWEPVGLPTEVKTLALRENLGIPAGRNHGVPHVSGEFL